MSLFVGAHPVPGPNFEALVREDVVSGLRNFEPKDTGIASATREKRNFQTYASGYKPLMK